MAEQAVLVGMKWKKKMKKYKERRITRAKICFLYYSLHIFKKFVKDKTKKVGHI